MYKVLFNSCRAPVEIENWLNRELALGNKFIASNGDFYIFEAAQQLEEDKVKEYLDSCIVFWRKKRDEEKDSSAVYYVDAFQSMQTSLFGETLSSNHDER